MALIDDDKARRALFDKCKKGLLRRAQELSVLCGCEVGVLLFDGPGGLVQFSSGSMESILSRYAAACTTAHESYTAEGAAPARLHRRQRDAEAEAQAPAKRGRAAGPESLHRLATSSLAAAAQAPEAPLSPRSARAFGAIGDEFDRLAAEIAEEEEEGGAPSEGGSEMRGGKARSGTAPPEHAAAAAEPAAEQGQEGRPPEGQEARPAAAAAEAAAQEPLSAAAALLGTAGGGVSTPQAPPSLQALLQSAETLEVVQGPPGGKPGQ